MMRFVPVLGNRGCQTLSAVVVCPCLVNDKFTLLPLLTYFSATLTNMSGPMEQKKLAKVSCISVYLVRRRLWLPGFP